MFIVLKTIYFEMWFLYKNDLFIFELSEINTKKT